MKGKNKFAVIGHPADVQAVRNYIDYYKKGKKINDHKYQRLFEWTPAFKFRDLNFTSKSSLLETGGFYVVSTFFPEMLKRSNKVVIKKIEDAVRLSEKLGAQVASLGAFTSIADLRGGAKVARAAENMAVTNGNTFTSAMVIEGVKKCARLLGIDLKSANITIVGGTGSIGRTCATYFMGKARKLTLTGRKMKKLQSVFGKYKEKHEGSLYLMTDNDTAVADADVVVSVTSTMNRMFALNSFKTGAMVVDVGFPKNISNVCIGRKDIIVFNGGLAKLPGEITRAKLYGLPSNRSLYGCFCESIVIAMAGCFEYCHIGLDDIPLENVAYLTKVAFRHGFDVAPFFNGNKYYTEKDFEYVREVRDRCSNGGFPN